MKKVASVTSLVLCALAVLSLGPAGALADPAGAPAKNPPAASQPAATAQPLTVAILDFDAGAATGGADIGKQAAVAIAAMLSDTKGFTLVDRASISKTLSEHALNLTGVVDADKAVQIGKLVGARILVTGKIFTLGKVTYVTAKMIGTETSLVEGILVKGQENDDIGDLLSKLSDKLAKQLVITGPKLVAPAETADTKLPALKARLAHLARPVVIVSIEEQHHGQVTPPIDPAVETEVSSMLQDCGFTVVDADHAAGSGATYKVTGQAFSEYAARVGNLVSCVGRAEISITSIPDGKVLLSTKATTRAVDLAERVAGKDALQKAGHELGFKLLEYWADHLPPAAPPKAK